MNRQMDFMFGGTRGPIRREYPLLNAWASEDGLLIRAEIPGVNADELDISMDGQNLTLSGSRETEELPEEARHYRNERIGGEFTRSVELPFDIDVEAIKASFADGVLEIELPRLPEEKPHRIAINGS
ncbi:MAG: Hsp20/alpha crystallin family protein [Chloroflexota bacterium]|nr:MAG: Hsp20/alpha crystallin family protein [Chloroflexota bacterium]